MTAALTGRRRERGFTLLELIIVVAIIGILATIAMPAMKDIPRRANEAVLRTNLRTIRDVIDQYYGDKGRYPPSLQALVEAGYFRSLPKDPITKSTETWTPVLEETNADNPPDTGTGTGDDPQQPGITDVHSGSPALALDGTPYATW